jgi:hypothetical protein
MSGIVARGERRCRWDGFVGEGWANGLPERSKTPRETYTSHLHQTPLLISAPPYESSANTFPTSPRLSQTYLSHNEGFRTPDGCLSRVNREEAGNGERLKVGQRRGGVFWCRKNPMSQLVLFFGRVERGHDSSCGQFRFRSFNCMLSRLNCVILNRSNGGFRMFDGWCQVPAKDIRKTLRNMVSNAVKRPCEYCPFIL